MSCKVYFAGELFDHKHLIGNRLLADAIVNASARHYQPVLPQETEPPSRSAIDIRNHDYRLLMETQAAIFNFDGPDLDSGTVAEFITAKMLDLPAVLIRTDFRHAGDQENGGDPWNLMCSGYPRTESLTINAMTIYQQHLALHETTSELLTHLYAEIGTAVVRKLNAVTMQPSVLDSADAARNAYRLVLRALGGGMEKTVTPAQLDAFIAARYQN